MPKLATRIDKETSSKVAIRQARTMAGVLLAWVVAHAFAVGEIIDLVLVGAGLFAVGWSVFVGIDHLYDFAAITYRAKNESDLDTAADHFAKAVGILGLQAVLAVVFRGAKLLARRKAVASILVPRRQERLVPATNRRSPASQILLRARAQPAFGVTSNSPLLDRLLIGPLFYFMKRFIRSLHPSFIFFGIIV